MRALILLHRWLGVLFCLLFAMWFASGMVMHFVPFPAPDEAERLAALAPIDMSAIRATPAQAVAASGLSGVMRLRLEQRADGPVYIATGRRIVALHAGDLSNAAIGSATLAVAIARDTATRLGLDGAAARLVAVRPYDQWTLDGSFNPHRPLYRVALGDDAGTELYVSSATGEIVLATDYRQRAWNYAGSIAHWIYPTRLRSHLTTWRLLLWSISLLALLGATAGAIIGVLQILRAKSPYRGWQKLHHWLGLASGVFVLSFIFSGWLSMDSGLLFSTGRASTADTAALTGALSWDAIVSATNEAASPGIKQIEWFVFGGRIYRRDWSGGGRQRLVHAEAAAPPATSEFLDQADIDAVAARLDRRCIRATPVAPGDAYAEAPPLPGTPVYRIVCGADWYDIDGADGVLLQKLDASRRAYRWLYRGLHRLDFPALAARPALRSTLIVALCGLGFVFSLTAVVIAWRRLSACLSA